MTTSKAPLISERDIYALTQRGEAEIRGANTTLSLLAIELLVRMDGTRSLGNLRFVLPDVTFADLSDTVGHLLRDQLIARTDRRDDVLEFDFGSGAAIAETDVLTTANPHEATESVNSLTRDGYFVRIARRPASQPQLPSDRAPIALVVEDEPVLARFVTH